MTRVFQRTIKLFDTLIETSQKYLRTDVRYVAGGGFWLTITQIITSSLAFVSTFFLANSLPKEVYGNYRYILSVSDVLSSFSLSGMAMSISRSVAQGKRGVLLPAFRTHLLWSSGTFLSTIGIALYYLINENQILFLSFLAVSILVPLTSGSLLYGAYLNGLKDFKVSSIYNTLSILLYSSCLITAALLTDQLFPVVFAYFGSQAIAGLYFLWRTSKIDIGTDTIDDTVNFSKHLSILNIFSTIAGQLDKVLIFQFIGSGSLAIYAISQLPLAQLQLFAKQVPKLAYPKFASTNITILQKTILRKVLIYSCILAVPVLIYLPLAPFLYNTFFPEYPEAILLSQISVLAIVLSSKKLFSMAIIAHSSKRLHYIISLSASAFKIVATIILLPLFGLWGAVLAELATQTFNFIMSVIIFFLTKEEAR